MAAGIEIYDQNGKLQFNGDMLSYTLRLSGTAYAENRQVGNTSPTSVMIPGTNSYPQALVALSGGNGYAAAYAATWASTGQRVFATGAPAGTPFNYFLFERSSTIPAANFGLEVRDATGQLTFSTNQRVMRVLDIIGNPDAFEPSSVTYPGRSLAYCQGAFAGHRFSSEPEELGFQNQWRWFNDGKAYGASVEDGGQTVTSRQVSWDDVTATQVGYPTLPPDVVWPLNMFIVDVTGVPVGVQFY